VDDVLVFNNGATTTVTGVPTQTIGQLSVSGNTTVNLQAAGVVTLTISGGGTGLSVAAGSALNCNANNAININVAAGTTGSISGSITFSAAASTAHTLIAVSANGITFNSGAVFTQGTNNTGNVFGSGTSNSVIFASGSTFVQRAGGNPFQKTQPASVVVFQTGSLFSHQMAGAPSFSGRTYANFELNTTGSPAVTGGNAVVMDNLTITAGTLNWGMTATSGHAIKGNILIASGGTLNFNPATPGTVNLSGGSGQTLSGAGAFTTTGTNGSNQTFNVNNANGITLQKDITISGGLTLTSGNISTGSNTLSIGSAGTVSRTSGHIIGNLLKAYAAAGSKTFEVGSANGYSPVTVNATTGTFPANVTVKATQGPQPNFPAPSKALQRYWTLTATGVTADLTFNYLAGDVPGTANENSFSIFKYNGTLTQPGGTVNAATHTATINGVTSFSDWTCAEPLGTPVPNCPTPLSTNQGTATSEVVSATDVDGTVTSASITSTAVPGITLDNFVPAPTNNTAATATLNVAATTSPGTYNVTIRYSNNDPTPETATCTVVVNVINQPINPNCPTPLVTTQGTATSESVSATDPDGTVTSASITSTPVPGITLDSFVPSPSNNTAATATLNVAATTVAGTYNVTIQYSNNDSPTPQTASCTVVVTVQPPPPPPNNVVISQVYGGGGNQGSTLKNDYIELINHSSSPVNLNGWSVQAFVSTTGTWQVTPLTNVTLQPGQYYLVQESQGAGGTDDLPAPDAIGTIPVSSTSTKVALLNNTTTITAACPNAGSAGIVDLVGYGPTDCFEGSGTAPLLSNTTAALRENEGCFDTNNNARDFYAGEPTPRNTSSATHDCTSLFGYGSANPSSVLQGASTSLTVQVAPAQNPTSTGITVRADLSSIGGSPSQSFSGGPNTFTFNATVSGSATPGIKSLPVTITDGQARSFGSSILLSVLPLTPNHITISQVYGGGGNSGATYTNDYVELYNPTSSTVTITGWSLQYGSATGTSWTNKQPIGGYIEPGQYYLVKLASGGANGAPLPVTPNISGGINMSATAGKIALVRNGDPLSGGCPLGIDPDVVDFVGYGTAANCHEGSANAPAPSNSSAIFRQGGGATDSDSNGPDFSTGTPNPRRTAPIVELGPWVAGTDPSTNGITVPHDASITVDFSEPVDVVGAWYNINCVSTGSHNSVSELHSSDFKTYVITPNVNFQFGEQCTVTIDKNSVHDRDTDDSGPDTDTLFANYLWSFTVVSAGSPAPYPPSVHLTMGNPSNATASVANPNNYLMEKATYTLSYNRDKGTPNWVSWHLDNSWYGTLARVDTFRPDPAVDPTWYRVQAFDYAGSGFDRGHMTPNADRDHQNRVPINQETYLMTNMVPQAPDNNQGPWANFEGYLRTLTDTGSEVYIISGPDGVGGSGANGGTTTTLSNGNITVPSSTWKVALVLPQGTNDLSRVNCSSRTIAIRMPNTQGIRSNPWESFLTTVDALETLTGYDFFSNLPPAVQACVEAGTNGDNPPGTVDQSATTSEDNSVGIVLNAVSPNPSPTFTYTIVSGPTHGTLTGSGANRAYNPAADYYGTDSFTFNVNDGTHTSNTSTVHITVTEVNDNPVANADEKTTDEDTQLNFSAADLTSNDIAGPNESGQTLTVTSVTATGDTHGSVTLTSGTVSYTPLQNYHGAASFSYQVCDNGTTNSAPDSKCATGTVNVTVASVNDDPDAVNDAATIAEDSGANTINVLGNDTDVDADTLSVSAFTQGTHGSVTNNSSSVSYTPAANFFGTDTFTYTVSDGHGSTDNATVTVTVTNIQDAPDAVNDATTINEDSGANTISVLSNDTDVDADALSVSAVTQGAHGSVTNNSSSVGYTPNANYFGTDTFTYTVSDGNGGTDTATVTVTVTNVQDAPDAVDDSATIAEDSGANAIDVRANDTDVDGDTLIVTAITQGTHGSVTITGGGTGASYTPAANFFGTDTFTYTVSDGNGGTDTATVTVTVTNVEDAPDAVNDAATINEDSGANAIDVRANDSDVDGDTVTVTAVTQGTHGSVAIMGGGTGVSYTPAANFFGTDTFTYTVSDGNGGSDTATVAVTVTNVQDAPDAVDDSATIAEDSGANAIDVRANDSDVDGDTVSVTAVTQGTHGSVAITGGGTGVSYTPAANFFGTDTFTYTVSDGHGGTDTATVTVTVTNVQDAPDAVDDSATIAEDSGANAIDVRANDSDVDGDNLSVTAVTQGTHGAVVITGGGSGVSYTPAANFFGSDSFTYTVSDGHGGTDTATVTVTVTNVQDAPDAVDDSATIAEDSGANAIDIRANDSDVDGDTVSVTAVTQGTHGSLAITGGGTGVSYTPAANFFGTDTFTYTVSDGHGGTDTATVTVTVTNVQDAPDAVDDSATIAEDSGANSIIVLSNDTDADGDTLSVSAVTQGAHGSVTNNGSSVSYTPNSNFFGTDTFTYTVSDGHGGTDTATVNITVTSVNDAPVAIGESFNVVENATLSVIAPGVLSNDSDIDSTVLSAVLVTGPAHAGSFGLNANGSFTFSPSNNYVGADSFTYQVFDGGASSNVVTVNITVAAELVTEPVSPGGTVSTGSEPTAADPTETSVTSPGAGTITIAETSTSEVPTGPEASSYNFLGLQVNIIAPVATPADPLRLVFLLDSSVIPAGQNFNTIEVFRNGVLVPACSIEALAASPQAAIPSPCIAGRELQGDNIKLTVLTAAASTWNFGMKKPELNRAPVAVSDSYTVDEDQLIVAAPSVLGNDTDADGNTLTATLVTSPDHGTLTMSANGSLTYSPNPNFNGQDTFTYKANDGTANSNLASVTITVRAVNDAPTANSQSVSTNANTAVSVALTGSDLETPSNLTYTITSGPTHGSLSGTGANRTYTPAANYSGPDSFKFTVTDAGDGAAPPLTSSQATVSITVNDTVAPTITLIGNTITLWPANHSYRTINVTDLVASASDNYDVTVNRNKVVISKVTSDEPERGPCTGSSSSNCNDNSDDETLNDIVLGSDCKSVQLRAERNGNGDGRVYTITFRVADAAGNVKTITAKVTAPHDQAHSAVDSGLGYTVNGTCP
jgi:DNA/RNA endonuclease G (NUC1)